MSSGSDLESSFEKLLGHAPTDAEKQNLLRVRDALGLKNNDALWLVLMALEHYDERYRVMPEAIAKATQGVLDETKEAAEALVRSSAAETKLELQRAVAASAQQVARQVAGKQLLQWLLTTVVVVSLSVGMLGWLTWDSGRDAGMLEGRAAGYERARDEKAAAAWANTPEGQGAYRLARLGSLPVLLSCDRPGWKVKDGICYVSPTPQGTYGWRVE